MPLSTEELVALEGKWVLAKRLGYDGALDGVTDLEDPDPYGFEAEYASDDIAGILTVKEITESDLVTSPEPYTIFVVGTELADPDTIEEDLSWKEEVAAHQPGKHDQKSHGNWAGTQRAIAQPFIDAADPRHAALLEEALAKHGDRLQHVMDNAGSDKMSDPKRGIRGEDSMGVHSEWGENGEWLGFTEEREAWQAKTLRELTAAKPNVKYDKQAIIMAGLPGAGKTYLLETELSDVFPLDDYVVVNADDLKENIVNGPGMPKVADLEGMELASLAHEESSYMSKVWEADLRSRGTNIVLDVTAANEAKMLQRIDALKEDGYTVHIVHADVTPVEAMISAVERFGSTHRPVPLEFIADMAAPNDPQNDKINGAFESYKSAVNGTYRSYRTQPVDHTPTVLQEVGP